MTYMTYMLYGLTCYHKYFDKLKVWSCMSLHVDKQKSKEFKQNSKKFKKDSK